LGPAPLALARSVLGSRCGPSSAWCSPRFSPTFPGPTHNEGQGCSGGGCPAALVLHPAGPAGRPSAGRQSETWPGEFAHWQAGRSQGPGTDRPGSSSTALLPRPRVTLGGDAYAARPEVRVRWGYRCRMVCPLGARAILGLRARRPGFRVPWFRPSPPRPRGSPRRVLQSQGLGRGPDSERMLRDVLDDIRFAPSAPVQRLDPSPDFARAAGFQAITVRSGARRPLQGRTHRGRDAGMRVGLLIGP
jgi:hypothetical protein